MCHIPSIYNVATKVLCVVLCLKPSESDKAKVFISNTQSDVHLMILKTHQSLLFYYSKIEKLISLL
jgi:hypothetical protein